MRKLFYLSLIASASLCAAQPSVAQKVFVAQTTSNEVPSDENTLDPVKDDTPVPPPPAESSLTPAAPPERVRHNDLPPEETKASVEEGEKIFDWSKHKGEREVPHPFAEKGLIRIDKDGAYYYKVDPTPSKHSASLQMGTFAPTQLASPPTDGNAGTTFKQNYGQSSYPAILLNYEWPLLRTAVGNLNLVAGSGMFFAQGHGHFVGTINQGKTPLENLTFAAFPNSVGAVYRMQFFNRQLFVPYGGGGGIAMAFTEVRDDNKGPKFGGALDAYADVGLAINMTYFDYLARVQLNREYGINMVYLTLEYRQIIALTNRYDFSTPYANAGFLVEY